MQGHSFPFRQLPIPMHAVLNPAPEGPPWRCNCLKHCKGILRQVSKRKYDLHAPWRTRPEDVLARLHPVVPPAQHLRAVLPDPALPLQRRATAVQLDPMMPGLMSSDSDADGGSGANDGDDEDEDIDLSVSRSVPTGPTSGAPATGSPRSSPEPENHIVFFQRDDDNEVEGEDPQPEVPLPDPEYGHTEDVGAPPEPRRKEVRDARAFIRQLKAAKLEDSGLSAETLRRLRDPPREPTG
ncbi:hypothetical protein BV20DRAFT_1056543 [Pilatotrama ljubarskyi]|nr:hypothetical protein BV20DRAFT_1056543 [Pilatotrama ljubarskyi]